MALSLTQPELPKGDAKSVATTVLKDTGTATYQLALWGVGGLLVLAGFAYLGRKGWLPMGPAGRAVQQAASAITDDIGTRLG